MASELRGGYRSFLLSQSTDHSDTADSSDTIDNGDDDDDDEAIITIWRAVNVSALGAIALWLVAVVAPLAVAGTHKHIIDASYRVGQWGAPPGILGVEYRSSMLVLLEPWGF